MFSIVWQAQITVKSFASEHNKSIVSNGILRRFDMKEIPLRGVSYLAIAKIL